MAAPSSSTDLPNHPAKYSAPILPVLGQEFDRWYGSGFTFNPVRVLDPFGGVGGIHYIKKHSLWHEKILSIGSELEFGWAIQGLIDRDPNGPMVQADALSLPFPDRSIHAVITSPCYGNRMADHHEAKDACSECHGSGLGEPIMAEMRTFGGEHAKTVVTEWEACKKCKGKGLSVRNTYTHQYGEKLRPESAAVMQWGTAYRNFHFDAWKEVGRVLRPGGLFLLNCSDHIRKGEVQEVTQWHIDCIKELDFKVQHIVPVETKRQKQGANGDKRVDTESVAVFLKEAA